MIARRWHRQAALLADLCTRGGDVAGALLLVVVLLLLLEPVFAISNVQIGVEPLTPAG